MVAKDGNNDDKENYFKEGGEGILHSKKATTKTTTAKKIKTTMKRT